MNREKIKQFKKENGNHKYTSEDMRILIYTELKEMRKEMYEMFMLKGMFNKAIGLFITLLGSLAYYVIIFRGL